MALRPPLFFARAAAKGYKSPMTSLDETQEARPFDTRLFLKAVAICFALLTVAGGLMWWRYGAVIFMDLLAFAQSCF